MKNGLCGTFYLFYLKRMKMPDSRVNGSLPSAVVKVSGYTERFEWMFCLLVTLP